MSLIQSTGVLEVLKKGGGQRAQNNKFFFHSLCLQAHGAVLVVILYTKINQRQTLLRKISQFKELKFGKALCNQHPIPEIRRSALIIGCATSLSSTHALHIVS